MSGNKASLTIAGSDTTHAAVAFQTEQSLLLSTGKECFLLVGVSTMDPEADVHPAADGLIRYYPIDI